MQNAVGASTSCLGKGMEESILALLEFEVIELGANHHYEEGVVETVERLCERYDLDLLLHGCFPPLWKWFILNPASQEGETLAETRRLILAMIDLARRWEVPLVSLHPGFTAYPTRPRGKDPGTPDVPYAVALRTAQESFQAFLGYAQGDVEIIAENLPYVYDNNAYDSRPVLSKVEGLKAAWGFSCLIEYRGQVILFDTGGDSPTLLANMATLGIDPGEIEAVVLSHIHGDHTGGLSGILEMAGDGLTVFVPRSFPARFKDAVRTRAQLVEVPVLSAVEGREPREIGEEVYTTGELGTGIIEQSLVVRTDEGLVVVTGCAHPGIVEIVRKARSLSGEKVYLVLGGFHLGGKSQREIE